jgi:hypothetical protein
MQTNANADCLIHSTWKATFAIGDTVRPSALAVLRLMASSNLVGSASSSTPNQHSNVPCTFILLRAHSKWIRRQRSAYKRNELAPPHGFLQGPTIALRVTSQREQVLSALGH